MTPESRGRYRRDFAHGLMFHRFHARSGASQWQGALSPEELERILLFVGVQNVLHPAEWAKKVRRHALQATDLCVTFDDGLRSQMEHALPVLNRHGIKAFWFVYSCVSDGQPVKSEIYSYAAGVLGGMETLIDEFLERCPSDFLLQLRSPEFSTYAASIRAAAPFYTAGDIRYRFLRNVPANKERFESLMDEIIEDRGIDIGAIQRTLWLSDADLKSLVDEGHAVGLHSYDHPYDIAGLSKQEQYEQYARNHAHIQAATRAAPASMSHPLGSYNDDSLSVLGKLGIQCGFRANAISPRGRPINSHPLELAREDSANLIALLQRQ